MKIEKRYKPELITSRDGTRIAITELNVANGRIEATNGMAAVRVPIESKEGEPDGRLSKESLIYARKFTEKGSDVELILTDSTAKAPNGTTFLRPEIQHAFPDIDTVWVSESTNPFVIALNPALLLSVAKAIGSEGYVRIYIKDSVSPLVVKPGKDNPACAVVMPMRVEGPTGWKS